MPTIPTGKMELELRALYLRWLQGLSYDSADITSKVDDFERKSKDLIEKMGGRTAMLGALADFPVPKRLDLSPHVGTIYSDMKQAAIQAGIIAGMNATDVARQMFNAGMGNSFHRLNRLARTETVRAYWKNAWDSIADLPLLVMVWGSEDGPRTCPWCRERDGMVMDSPNLRDHPNGRCTPIPTLRSAIDYHGSVRADGTIYKDPAWNKTNRGKPLDTQPAPAKPVTMDLGQPQPNPVPPTNPRVIKTMKDMDDFGKSMVNPRSISPAAKSWVDDYIAGTAYQTNAVLRAQKSYRGRPIDTRTKVYVKKTTKTADDMFAKSLVPEDVKVVRAVRVDAFGGEDKLRDLAGSIYQDKGYMSTSLADKVSSNVYSVAEAVEMEIKVPKGTQALYMAGDSYLRSERELLLNRGTSLAVESVTYDERKKKWKLVATVIPG